MASYLRRITSLLPQGRRSFLKALVLAMSAAAGFLGRKALSGATHSEGAANAAPLPTAPGNELLRMQEDLQAALSRPMEFRRWAMVVDPRKCIGCQACVIACRAENVVGPDGSYRRVPEAPAGAFPNMTNVFMPTNCVQCDDPPCERAVPAGMVKKHADGIVEFDYSRLTGAYAEAARAACPYRAAHVDRGKFFTSGTPEIQPYEKRSFTEYQKTWNRQDGTLPSGVARKCHFCLDRLEAGMFPACVSTCIGRAMYFGDLSNSKGLVSELIRTSKTIRIHEELGIEPRVYYVEEKLSQVRQYSCATCH